MSILAFGGEMGFFVPSDSTVTEATTSSYYNSTFARSFMLTGRNTAYAETPTVATTADFWIHFDMNLGSGFATQSGGVCTLYDSGGIARIRLRSNGGASSTAYLDKWDGALWTEIGNIDYAASSNQTIDIHVKSNTASGSAELYVAGTLRIDSGTIDLSGFSGITKARFTGRGSAFVEMGFSQIVMASEPTIGMRVNTLVMTGQGTTHTFTTGGYGNIDENAYSDADFIQSGTANQIELFTGTPIASFTGYTIRAIALTARAKGDGAAPTKFRFILRSGGSNYDNGADLSLGFGYGGYCAVWETNPATAAAFLSSEIASLEFGVESIT